MKSIAIMQPTFLPWLGYFALLDRVDEFVFLDDVQFDHRSWQQRNRIKTRNGEQMITLPVHRKGLQHQFISDVRIHYGDAKVLIKIWKTICLNYSKAPYFKSYGEELSEIFLGMPDRLLDLNCALIAWGAKTMQIGTPTLFSSQLAIQEKREDKLLGICQERQADIYISPPGSQSYLEGNTSFCSNGIKLIYHNFTHPIYKQCYGDFVPYMSFLDLIFNYGKGSLKIIRGGNDRKF
ncbi:WbqC family protein [Kiloniella majae]|uniref:WbqC family protein n=1 Tax=Kiloniella majae TaxID=1938558 RepID=UPI000A2778E6|nr:WbqC family protein [Kiloniella majae]